MFVAPSSSNSPLKVARSADNFFQWTNSPLCQLDCMSPNGGTMSFSLSSPPCHIRYEEIETPATFGGIEGSLNATISPSIFSPQEKKQSKMWKKRDYYQRDYLSNEDSIFSSEKIARYDEVENSVFNAVNSLPQFPPILPSRKATTSSSSSSSENEKAVSRFSKLRAMTSQASSSSTPQATTIPAITPDTASSASASAATVNLPRKGGMSESKTLSIPKVSENKPPRSTAKHTAAAAVTPASSERRVSFGSQSAVAVAAAAAMRSNSPFSPTGITCNCKKSKCLKLYCDCFAAMAYCNRSTCNCMDCNNNADNEATRQAAINSTKERNANAFQTKVAQKGHATGCHCKNSHCLKKYCECFNGGAMCGANCKCQSCQNNEVYRKLEKEVDEDISKIKITPTSSALPRPSSNSKILEQIISPVQLMTTEFTATPPVEGFKFPAAFRVTPDTVTAIGKSEQLLSAHAQHPSINEGGVYMDDLAERGIHTESSGLVPHGDDSELYYFLQACSEDEHFMGTHENSNSNHHQQQQGGRRRRTKERSVTFQDSTSEGDSRSTAISSTSSMTQEFEETAMSDTEAYLSLARSIALSGGVHCKASQIPEEVPPGFAKSCCVAYRFFGPRLPATPKLTALKCLDYLSGSDIYSMSLVNSLWAQAAVDEALWEG